GDMAIIRSMATREGDHGRATYQMRTGNLPGAPQFPTLGSLVSKELGRPDADLPNFVSIAPYPFFSPAAYGPGFLGPRYAPLVLGGGQLGLPVNVRQQTDNYQDSLRVPDIASTVNDQRSAARIELLNEMEQDSLRDRPGLPAQAHRSAYQQ